MLGPKYAGGIYSELRAFAVVGDPLARRLIDSARKKNVVDLSVVLADDRPVSWPGRGVGNHRQPLTTIRWGINPNTRTPFEMHMLDSHAGTHLVPPAYALPPAGFDDATYAPEVKTWLAEYEAKYGRRGTSDVTTEKVPISQTCGPARVIDVAHLRRHDGQQGAGRPRRRSPRTKSGSDEARSTASCKPGISSSSAAAGATGIFRPFPEGKACLDDPLNGRSEGWPAPGPDAIVYLASKGIRCVATDAPTLGGVEPEAGAHDLLGPRQPGDGRRGVS